MRLNLKIITPTILIIYFLLGIYLSINTGISHDEFHEQLNWEIHIKAIYEFFKSGSYDNLLNYKDRYHGVGFHLFSQPFQYIFSTPISEYLVISKYGGILLSKHIAIFIIFFVSGLFFYKICRLLINNNLFCNLSILFYLFYPYLFGHSLFNPKDIPFLSLWVICTYFIIKILKELYCKKKVRTKNVLILSFLTSYLISIRITGILIFVEYLVFLLVYLENQKIKVLDFLKQNLRNIFILIISVSIFTYLLNPVFWHNPFELINSVSLMSKFNQNICTTTLGKCMSAQSLPASYYFIWLFFKLPIIIIFGIATFPFIENKLDKEKFSKSIIYSLIISFGIILIIFIIRNVAIYDELRHIMFLFPIIIITSLYFLFLFNRNVFLFLVSLSIIIFIVENVKLNPYQYTWLNSFAKLTNINENFEKDYWGISNKELNNSLIKNYNSEKTNKNICVYGDAFSEVFLDRTSLDCFKTYSQLDEANDRPFYVIQNLRNTRRSNPKDCQLITNEKYKYFLSKQEIVLGSLWYCN